VILQTKSAKAAAKRFWPKVSVTKNPYKCWEWKASKNKAGYGQISIGGRKGRPLLAHRVSWMIHNGAVPRGFIVIHDCDNPGCVRPGHLRIGTDAENKLDASLRGRIARGKKLPHTKLTVRQVTEIRRMYTRMIRKAVKRYRISRSMVSAILNKTRRVK